MRMTMNSIDACAVRASTEGHWLAVLERLAPELGQSLIHPGRHGPCPIHGGRDGFRLFRDVADTGGGICATCGAFPDGLALLRWLKGWRFPAVLEAVAGVLGVQDRRAIPAAPRWTPAHRAASETDGSATSKRIARVWAEAIEPADPIAAPLYTYLWHRGLDPDVLDADVVRFHPALGYWEEGRCLGRFPAMLARVCDPQGIPLTLHRTYLTRDGSKAPVGAPKKLMPYRDGARLRGGAIRLFRPGSELGIAEGIETALAAHCMSGMPVWSAGCASLLARVGPPAAARRVVVWADRDRSGTGEQAALSLRERLRARGIAVAIRLPPGHIPAGTKGVDWADLWAARYFQCVPRQRAA